MNLTLIGHDDRYAVEQLLLSLFPENTPVEATSKLSRGQVYLTVLVNSLFFLQFII